MDRIPPARQLYVHNDLAEHIWDVHGGAPEARALAAELLALLRCRRPQVVVLGLEEQIAQLVGDGEQQPFPMAVAIGRAGESVARQIHQRTGWFPHVRRVDIAREEDGRGGYRVVSLSGATLRSQLGDLEGFGAVALVDDTIFSGLTMRTVLGTLPPTVAARAQVLALRGVAQTVAELRSLCPVRVGFEAAGRLHEDVSFIKATGLFTAGAIRRAGRSPLAFFERREWMEAWFGAEADRVIAVCRRLHALARWPEARIPDRVPIAASAQGPTWRR